MEIGSLELRNFEVILNLGWTLNRMTSVPKREVWYTDLTLHSYIEMEAVNGGDGETGERVVGPAGAEPEKDALLHLEASLGHHLPGLTQLHLSPFKSGFLQSSYLII